MRLPHIRSFLDPLPPNNIPPAPGSLSVDPDFCYGYNRATWGTVSGSSYYELYHAAYSNFKHDDAFAELVYSGTSHFSAFSIPGPQDRFVRVRACSTKGCSALSSTVDLARYFNNCF